MVRFVASWRLAHNEAINRTPKQTEVTSNTRVRMHKGRDEDISTLQDNSRNSQGIGNAEHLLKSNQGISIVVQKLG